MAKGILAAALLIAVGVFAGRVFFSAEAPSELPTERRAVSSRSASDRLDAGGKRSPRDRFRAELERRAERPRAEGIEKRTERHRREDETVAVQRPANSRPAIESSRASESNVVDTTNPPANSEAVPIDDSTNPIERALIIGGLDPQAAADVKRRYDNLENDERSLHVDAANEDWSDSPEFYEELEAIETERLAIRDEIGDTAYDYYLFAKGKPNRVFVTDVLGASAEQAGLQTGDVIVRYGAARIFSPDDLVGETSVGNPGEVVWLEVRRQDSRLKLEVPAGPLGVQVGRTQDPPEQD
jgi:hypothetical protein